VTDLSKTHHIVRDRNKSCSHCNKATCYKFTNKSTRARYWYCFDCGEESR